MIYWKDLFIGQTATVKTYHAVTNADPFVATLKEILITDIYYTPLSYFRIDCSFIDSRGNVSIKGRSYDHIFSDLVAQVLNRKLHQNRWIVPEVGDYLNSFVTKKLPKDKKIVEIKDFNLVRFEGSQRFTKLEVDQFILPYPEPLTTELKMPVLKVIKVLNQSEAIPEKIALRMVRNSPYDYQEISWFRTNRVKPYIIEYSYGAIRKHT